MLRILAVSQAGGNMRDLSSWRHLRPGPIVLVFLLTLGVLLGGRVLANKLQVDHPLARDLRSIPGVRDYVLEKEAGVCRLRLSMARVKDLEQTVERALRATERHLGEPVNDLSLQDCRGGLVEAYYKLRFRLEEAMATGRYAGLMEALDDLREEYGLERARIYLGRRFLFIQLEKGRSFLYEAVPRMGGPRPEIQGSGV